MTRHRVSGLYPRIAAAISAAVASLLASIALPSAVITAFAVAERDAAEISRFALAVAEPLGVLGAAVATFFVSRWAVRSARGGRALVPWVGGASAAAIVGAAGWTGDFDWWTVAAAGLLPAVAILAGRRSVRPDPLRGIDPSAPAAGLPDEAATRHEVPVREPVER